MTDVPYQMTVGGAFVYVRETWERGRVNHYNTFFPRGPRRPCYNEVAVESLQNKEYIFFLSQMSLLNCKQIEDFLLNIVI